MTDSVQIDDWQCTYLDNGWDGPGWYTYLLGRLILKVDDRRVAGYLLPLLDAGRLAARRQG